MLEHLYLGFGAALAAERLLFMAVGTFVGLWIGVVPGLGPVMAMAILVPFTFGMDPLSGLLMLASIHVAGTYGGSVSAILLNIPGDAASAATTFDGYSLARQGKVRVALGLSVASSLVGSFAGIAALILAAQPLVDFALRFGPPEYFALAILGLTVVAAASIGSTLKGLVMGCLGLSVGFIGIDSVLGYPRYTFGVVELEAKIAFVPVLIGLFAVSELMLLMSRGGTIAGSHELSGRLLDGIGMAFRRPLSLLRGIATGIFVGVVPGVGAVTANFLAYVLERRSARDPSRFGKGAAEGVIAPEASNNACISAALIPTLTLGVPGSSGAAILLVAITVHGLRPGPLLFTSAPDLVYGFFAGLLIGAVMFAALGILLVRWFAVVTIVPVSLLAPILLVVSIMGAYAYQESFLDVIVAIVFGMFGFWARAAGYPVIGLVMGLILGEMAETAFHQSLQISMGSYLIFVERPLSLAILLVALLAVAWPAIGWLRRSRASRDDAGARPPSSAAENSHEPGEHDDPAAGRTHL